MSRVQAKPTQRDAVSGREDSYKRITNTLYIQVQNQY